MMTNYDSNYEDMINSISGVRDVLKRMSNNCLADESAKSFGMTQSELVQESCLGDLALCYNELVREECFLRFLDYSFQFPDDSRG